MAILPKMGNDIRHLTIQARDGYALAATLFDPGSDHKYVMVINAATAVPRSFYAVYAQHLRQAGYLVVTYDYRGMGESRPSRLRGFQARMRDWVELDMAGVIDWVHRYCHPHRLVLVGHSFGGQAPGLLDNADKVDAMVTVSAQSGYWALMPSPEKYRIWLYAYVLMPMLAYLFGYLPWGRFARGEDLPKGVALEWAYWCRLPDYLCGDQTLSSLHNFRNFTSPVLAYSFSDDKWGSRRSVDAMMARYVQAKVERRHKTPQDVDGNKIGHLGFFLPTSLTLWREVDEWIHTVCQEK